MIDKVFYSDKEKMVALTFDDGPNKIFTEWLLDVLKELNINATFFCIGNRVISYPNLIQKIKNENHLVCNHSYSHPHMSLLNADRIKNELLQANSIIKNYTGYTSVFFRPPYGEDSGEVASTAKSLGFEVIKWDPDLDTKDYSGPGVPAIVNTIMSASNRTNCIILCHDGLDKDNIGISDRCQTVNAVKEAVPKLKAAGCKFVTVAELLNTRGISYASGQTSEIAMDSSGRCISVYINNGKLFYKVGTCDFIQKRINWGQEIQYCAEVSNAMSNSISMDWGGKCIEVHQVQATPHPLLYYTIGAMTSDKRITWGAAKRYDDGGPNAIAFGGNGKCVEVHVGGSTLYYRVGVLDVQSQEIKWGTSTRYDNGQQNAIAINSFDKCVEIHVNAGKLYYRVAKNVDFTTKSIEWGDCIEYDVGEANAISLDPNGRCLEVHSRGGNLFYRTGRIDYNLNKINWYSVNAYNGSGKSSIAMDTNGNCIEGNTDGSGKIYYRIGKYV